MKEFQTDIKAKGDNLLNGVTILVTRPKERSATFILHLKKSGARIIEFPTIKITETDNQEEINNCIGQLDHYDIIVFNSINAVNFFMKKLPSVVKEKMQSKKIFVVGPKTREAAAHWGIKAELINSDYNGAELGNAIVKKNDPGKHILIPHGNAGKGEMADRLKKAGFEVTELTVYKNAEPDEEDIKKFLSETENGYPDVLTFFSPSSIRNLLKVVNIPSSCVVAVIGPTTAQAAEAAGLKPRIIAKKATSEHLASAIVDYYKTNRKGISFND